MLHTRIRISLSRALSRKLRRFAHPGRFAGGNSRLPRVSGSIASQLTRVCGARVGLAKSPTRPFRAHSLLSHVIGQIYTAAGGFASQVLRVRHTWTRARALVRARMLEIAAVPPRPPSRYDYRGGGARVKRKEKAGVLMFLFRRNGRTLYGPLHAILLAED